MSMSMYYDILLWRSFNYVHLIIKASHGSIPLPTSVNGLDEFSLFNQNVLRLESRLLCDRSRRQQNLYIQDKTFLNSNVGFMFDKYLQKCIIHKKIV